MENLRRTGKTFRRLLTGLVKASQGESVVFITDNMLHANFTYNLAINSISSSMLTNLYVSNNVIEFPHNLNSDKQGYLKFMTYEKWYDETRGKSYIDHIVIDDTTNNKIHYVDVNNCEYEVE